MTNHIATLCHVGCATRDLHLPWEAELVPVPVAVVDLAFRVTSLYGLDGRLALWLGLVGMALWGALFLVGRAVEGR